MEGKKVTPSPAASGDGEDKAQPCKGGGLSGTCHTPAAKAEAKPVPKPRAAGPSALQGSALSFFSMQLQSPSPWLLFSCLREGKK